jgi:muramoyltetrapeptide carboxypeptidase
VQYRAVYQAQYKDGENMNDDMLHAPRLKPGDLVRLVSPASYPQQSDVDRQIKTVESWGLRCDAGKHVISRFGYMAGTDAQRLADLNDAFEDPEVRAIVTTRGGAGAYRIASGINFNAVRADPKPLIGFSDITSLHLALQYHCNLGGIHGCLFGSAAKESVRQLLMTSESVTLSRVPETVSAAISYPGCATGKLIGGNLQLLAASVAVHLPSLHGAILFLEYHRTGLGTVDRYLTQLLQSDILHGVAGVVLGSFECSRGYSDRGWTMIDVLNDRLGQLGVPVLGGIYAGHDLPGQGDDEFDQSSLPLGSMATMDAEAGTLTIEPIVC